MSLNIENNVPLAPLTTYRVGGPAKFFARAKKWEDIREARDFAEKEGVPMLIFGGGSNVLFADEGYPGLVVLNEMDKVEFEGETVTAETGVTVAKLAMMAAEKGLGGMSGMAYVPGTIGGAVYGNAGIPEVCMADLLIETTVLPNDGDEPIILKNDECHFSYRSSVFKETRKFIVLSAKLQLQPAPRELTMSQIATHMKARQEKQPVGRSCGSFFKNPEGFPGAGWLIEHSGCKGMKLGGAQISEKHGNFVMNMGDATANDILELTLKVRDIVKQKYDVTLEPEVQIYPKSPF